MTAERGYDIFPRTWKARLLLALAFVGGMCLIAGWFAFTFLLNGVLSGLFERPPCSGSKLEGCLAAQAELAPKAQDSCEGSGSRICFVPLGQVDPDLVRNLVDYYRDQYGLRIGVLSPSAVPAEIINRDREQIDCPSLADYLQKLFPADYEDPNVVLIGLTPLDLYDHGRQWNFEMACWNWSDQARGVVSTYRLHLGTFRLVNDERVLSRSRKLVTKGIGLMFYHLSTSDDPTSPMYGHIMSVSDLDKMKEPLDGP